MAKIDNFVNFTPQDYPDSPEWFRRFLDRLNPQLEQLTSALQAGLTTRNENAEILELALSHNVTQKIKAPNVRGTIEEVWPIWSDTPISSFSWEKVAGGINVTASFSGSPSDLVNIGIKVKGSD